MLQNTEGLNPLIKSLGCYFLSLMRIIEIETNTEFEPHNANMVWITSKQKNYIDLKNNIIDPDHILKEFSLLTKSPSVRFAQVGEEKDGKIVYWNWVKDKSADYLIEMVKTSGKYGTHFRLCNIDKTIIYDSYSYNKYKCEQVGRYLLYKRLS